MAVSCTCHKHWQLEFPVMHFSVLKYFKVFTEFSVKRSEKIALFLTNYLHFKRQRWYHCTTDIHIDMHIANRILKLNSTHASFSDFVEFNERSAPPNLT